MFPRLSGGKVDTSLKFIARFVRKEDNVKKLVSTCLEMVDNALLLL
jgi:hypothetical protein